MAEAPAESFEGLQELVELDVGELGEEGLVLEDGLDGRHGPDHDPPRVARHARVKGGIEVVVVL